MRTYPLVIFDLDGTLYRGSEVIPEAPEVLAELRRRGSQIRFLTNNSSQTAEFTANKLTTMGIPAAPDEVMTTAIGTGRYLMAQGLDTAYVVGEPGLIETLQRSGVQTLTEGQAKAVVVGICRTLTYQMLNDALQQLIGGATFIATNADVTYPMEGGRVVPGAGTMVAAMRACSEREPIVIGKPQPTLVTAMLEDTGVAASDCLVVGDRYDTDILAGINAGCDTLMVLTGVTRSAPRGVTAAMSLRALLG